MPSNYAKYIKERENKNIIEDDRGFITYFSIDNGKGIQVEDVFVLEEFRKKGVAKEYFDMIEYSAKESKCEYIITSVDMKTKNWEVSVNGLCNNEYSFIGEDSSDSKFLYFIKRIVYG